MFEIEHMNTQTALLCICIILPGNIETSLQTFSQRQRPQRGSRNLVCLFCPSGSEDNDQPNSPNLPPIQSLSFPRFFLVPRIFQAIDRLRTCSLHQLATHQSVGVQPSQFFCHSSRVCWQGRPFPRTLWIPLQSQERAKEQGLPFSPYCCPAWHKNLRLSRLCIFQPYISCACWTWR